MTIASEEKIEIKKKVAVCFVDVYRYGIAAYVKKFEERVLEIKKENGLDKPEESRRTKAKER